MASKRYQNTGLRNWWAVHIEAWRPIDGRPRLDELPPWAWKSGNHLNTWRSSSTRMAQLRPLVITGQRRRVTRR